MVTSIKFASFNVQDIKYCLFRVFFLDLEGIQIKRVSLRVNQVGHLQASKMLGMIQLMLTSRVTGRNLNVT